MNKKYTNSLKELVQANPDLPVIAEVDTEVVQSDEYSYWYGEFYNARVDEYCMYTFDWESIHDTILLTKSDGLDKVYDDIYDSIEWAAEYPDVHDEALEEKITMSRYEALPWKKAIFVRVIPWYESEN